MPSPRKTTAEIYGLAMAAVLGKAAGYEAINEAATVIQQMAPRDPLEEMLIAQMLFAHARVARLTDLANSQSAVENIRTVNEYADRASNTYRRLMLALVEYRRPPRTGDTFAVVHQANIAGQQVILNHEHSTANAMDEQGSRAHATDASRPADAHGSPTATPALTPHNGGAGFGAFSRQASKAVDEAQRPAEV